MTVLLPPSLCIYCGQELKKVRRGEHIVPEAIGGVLTISDVCKVKKVCQKCNNGVLSELDDELCRKSFLSIVSAHELKSLLGQCWDIDHSSDNLLLESTPDFAGDSQTVCPQMVFETFGAQLRGDHESLQRVGADRCYKVFVRYMLEAFQEFRAGIKRRIHLKRIPTNRFIQSQYRYPPRIFSRSPIDEFRTGMSFELRALDEGGLKWALSRLDNWDASATLKNLAVHLGAAMGAVRLSFEGGKVLRALVKMGINLLAAYCPNTPVNRDGFRDVIQVIVGELDVASQLLRANGFVVADDVQAIKAASAHSFRLLYMDNHWHVYASFFGGRIGSVVRIPGPSRENWICADIVMPIRSRDVRFSTGGLLQPLTVRVEWKDVRLIIPSINVVNPTTETRVEQVPRRQRGQKR